MTAPHGMILDKALMVLQNTGNLIKAERDLILSYINYHEGIVSKYQNKNGALVENSSAGLSIYGT